MSKPFDSKYNEQMKMIEELENDGYQVTKILDGVPVNYNVAWKLHPRTLELFASLSRLVEDMPEYVRDGDDIHKVFENCIRALNEKEKELKRKDILLEQASDQITKAYGDIDNAFVSKINAEEKIEHMEEKLDRHQSGVSDEEQDVDMEENDEAGSDGNSPMENPEAEDENVELDYLSSAEDAEVDSFESKPGESAGVSEGLAAHLEQELRLEIKRLTKANAKHWANLSKLQVSYDEEKTATINASKRLLEVKKALVRVSTLGVPDPFPELDEASLDLLNAKHAKDPKTFLYLNKPGNAVAFSDEFNGVPEIRHNISLTSMLASLTVVRRLQDAEEDRLYALLAAFHTGVHNVASLGSSIQHSALNRYITSLIGLKFSGLAAALQIVAIANLVQRESQPNQILHNLKENPWHEMLKARPFTSWNVLEKISFTWLRAVYGTRPDWLAEFLLNLYADFVKNMRTCRDFVEVLLHCQDFVDEHHGANMLVLEEEEKKTMIIINCTDTDDMGEVTWAQYVWTRHNGKVFFSDSGAAPRVKMVDDSFRNWQVQTTCNGTAVPWFTLDMEALKYFTIHYEHAIVGECEAAAKKLELEVAALKRGEKPNTQGV